MRLRVHVKKDAILGLTTENSIYSGSQYVAKKCSKEAKYYPPPNNAMR